MKVLAACGLLLGIVCSSLAVKNLQEWSVQTYLGADYTFTCNDTYGSTEIAPDDTVQWRKHGHDGHLTNNDHYELTEMHGIVNFQLKVKDINDGMMGVYLCDVMFNNGTHRDTVVKGLNLGGHLYEDNIDKYDENIVVGVIAGASVFVFIVGIGLIERFRYLTDEQKQKRRERKSEREAKMKRWETSGQVNTGADLDMTEDVKKPIDGTANGEQREVNTHL